MNLKPRYYAGEDNKWRVQVHPANDICPIFVECFNSLTPSEARELALTILRVTPRQTIEREKFKRATK